MKIKYLITFLLLLGTVADLSAQTRRNNTQTKRDYPSQGTLGSAVISSDPETRRLIIITDEETHKHIDEVIKNLDKPKPQVFIKVIFAEVTYRNDSDIGVEGVLTHSLFSDRNQGTATTSLGPAGTLSTGGTWRIISGHVDATLRVIQEVGKTEILSRPAILTRNNQEAVITVGQEVPFITNSRITDQGQVINTVQYEDVGIILRVTPFITSKGQVEMLVAPEISSLGEDSVPLSDAVEARVINKRSAETVVMTRHAQTIVIGGMMQNTQQETVRKIPLLGDIPIVKHAFRRKTKERVKTELLIFLTPYIIESYEDLDKTADREVENALNLMNSIESLTNEEKKPLKNP